jgi:hypothetical protein
MEVDWKENKLIKATDWVNEYVGKNINHNKISVTFLQNV